MSLPHTKVKALKRRRGDRDNTPRTRDRLAFLKGVFRDTKKRARERYHDQ